MTDSFTMPPRMFVKPKGSGRVKPPQPTILRRSTARSMAYLQDKGLTNWEGIKAVVAQRFARQVLPNGLVKLIDMRGTETYGV